MLTRLHDVAGSNDSPVQTRAELRTGTASAYGTQAWNHGPVIEGAKLPTRLSDEALDIHMLTRPL